MKLIQKIKNLFRKKIKPQKEDGFAPIPRKWGIIVPHTEKAQGAKSKTHNLTEYKYGLKVANISSLLWETRNKGGVFGAASRLRKQGVNCTIEPHLNAFNGKAHGFELLVMKDDKVSISHAKLMVEAFIDKYPNRRIRGDKGIKYVSKGDRGYNNLKIAKSAGMDIVILSEIFFIDNPNDFLTHQNIVKYLRSVLV